MTSPNPSEFVNGKHWADVIGCDRRAEIPEIMRVYQRRTIETEDPARLTELRQAFDLACQVKR